MKVRRSWIVIVAIAAIGAAYALWPRHDTLPVHHCDDPKTRSVIDACMNHVFPTGEQIHAYLDDASFRQAQAGTHYTLQYFDHDGRYVLLSFGGESVPWGVAFINSGRWWLHEAVLPLQAGNETKKLPVQQVCSLEYTWTDTPRDVKDEDPDVSCTTVWDLSGNTFQEGDKPQSRAGGDVYDLLKLYRMDGHQFRIQDFSSVAPDAEVPPEELARAAHLYESKQATEGTKP